MSAMLPSRQLWAQGPHIVAIGGGTGLSTMLRGLKKYTKNLTAIVTVSDDGVGFDPEQPPQDGKEHVGLQLVRGRLQMVCGAKLTTQIKIGQGTLMRVLIPYSCDETAGSFTQTKAPSH